MVHKTHVIVVVVSKHHLNEDRKAHCMDITVNSLPNFVKELATFLTEYLKGEVKQ